MTSLNLALLDLTILLLVLIHWSFNSKNEIIKNEVRCNSCDFFLANSKCIKCQKDVCLDCYAGIGTTQICEKCYFGSGENIF